MKVFFSDFALHICWKLFWKGSFCFHQPYRRQGLRPKTIPLQL